MADDEKLPDVLNFDYIKANDFRVVHADGAFVALSRTGLTLTFYSERQPIPRRIVHGVKADGSLGDEIRDQRVVRDAIIRDVQFTATMTLDVANNVRGVLENLIGKFEELQREQAAVREKKHE